MTLCIRRLFLVVLQGAKELNMYARSTDEREARTCYSIDMSQCYDIVRTEHA
jgi:hypothetical protein